MLVGVGVCWLAAVTSVCILRNCGSKDVFCVIKLHNKKAQNHELEIN